MTDEELDELAALKKARDRRRHLRDKTAGKVSFLQDRLAQHDRDIARIEQRMQELRARIRLST